MIETYNQVISVQDIPDQLPYNKDRSIPGAYVENLCRIEDENAGRDLHMRKGLLHSG